MEKEHKEGIEPIEDCISRQEAIQKAQIVPIAPIVAGDNEVVYRKAVFVEDMEALPSAQPITTSEDCISRRAALRINELHHGSMPNEVNHEIWEQLKDLPSVQPKHGEWMYMPGMNEQCSECGEYFPVHELTANRPFTINYCPNCGSRMDKQI